MKKHHHLVCLFMLVSLYVLPPALQADQAVSLSRGEMIYVPAYSHIYGGNSEKPFLLTVTLSIRNIDPRYRINVTVADYYDSQGKLLKKYIDKPVVLKPLESLRYVIPERDVSGGSGANFVVEWTADDSVNPPLVESIMIGTQLQQGVSFTSRGRVVVAPR